MLGINWSAVVAVGVGIWVVALIPCLLMNVLGMWLSASFAGVGILSLGLVVSALGIVPLDEDDLLELSDLLSRAQPMPWLTQALSRDDFVFRQKHLRRLQSDLDDAKQAERIAYRLESLEAKLRQKAPRSADKPDGPVFGDLPDVTCAGAVAYPPPCPAPKKSSSHSLRGCP